MKTRERLMAFLFVAIITFSTLNISIVNATGTTYGDLEKHWAKKSVEKLIDAGIVNEAFANAVTFGADIKITRAEIVELVLKANLHSDFLKAALNEVKDQISYSDVGNHKLKGYIELAKKFGIASGYPDGTFKADGLITRAEFATLMVRSQEVLSDIIKQNAITINFTDFSNSHWAYDFVMLAAKTGLVSGYPDGSFGAEREVTRAEAYTMISNFYDLCFTKYKGIVGFVGQNGSRNENVTVNLINIKDGKTAQMVKTNKYGQFRFYVITKDNYRIEAVDGDYLAVVPSINTLATDSLLKDVLVMEKTIQVAGTAYDKRNALLSYTNLTYECDNLSFSNMTDAYGLFNVNLLPNRTYRVHAVINGQKTKIGDISVKNVFLTGLTLRQPSDYVYMSYEGINDDDNNWLEPNVAPTVNPTQAPTPTVNPTQAPTPIVNPTQAPTPTVNPTQAPTPTVNPTQAPTPTVNPTQAPTPTVNPTQAPTPNPTLKPPPDDDTYWLYSVTDIMKSGGNQNLSLEVSASDECYLELKILSDVTGLSTDWTSGSEITRGKIGVSGGIESEFVDVLLSSTLPEYFVAVATLMSESGEALSDSFVAINYTKAHELFISKTINDFDNKTVLSLDDDESDNFMVLEDGIGLVYSGVSGINHLDDSNAESGIYVFYNADTVIKSLQPGDKLVAVGSDDQSVYMIDVASVSIDGDTVTVISNAEPSFQEYFTYAKLNYDDPVDRVQMDMSEASEGVRYVDDPSDVQEITFDGSNSQIAAYGYEDASYAPMVSMDMRSTNVVNVNGAGSTGITFDIGGSINTNQNPGGNTHTNARFTVKSSVTFKLGLEFTAKYDAVLFGKDYFYVKAAFTTETQVDNKFTLGGEFKADNKFENLGKLEFPKIKIPTPIPGLKATVKVFIPFKINANGSYSYSKISYNRTGFVWIMHSGYQKINDKQETVRDRDIQGQITVSLGVRIELGAELIEGVLEAVIYAEPSFELKCVAFKNMIDGKLHLCVLCVDGELNFSVKAGFRLKYNLGGIFKGEAFDLSLPVYKPPEPLFSFYVSLINDHDSIHGGHIKFDINTKCPNVREASMIDPGILKGVVKSAENGNVIPNAQITVMKGTQTIASKTTDSSGSYEIKLNPDDYVVVFSADGFRTFNYYITIESNRTHYAETSLLVDNTPGDGTVMGTIRDALTNNVLSGVTLTVREGWGNTASGLIVGTYTTNSSGSYSISLPKGNYTVSATKDGYITDNFNIVCTISNSTKNVSLAPVGNADVCTIVLSWGATPRDLDSHLIANNAHVYYNAKTSQYAWLDIDDTTSYGPETTTITSLANLGGFKYCVHNYTDRSTTSDATRLASSGATVRVYQGSTLLRTYNIPSSEQGTVWNVFSISVDGIITDLNTFEYESNPSSVGRGNAQFAATLSNSELKDYEIEKLSALSSLDTLLYSVRMIEISLYDEESLKVLISAIINAKTVMLDSDVDIITISKAIQNLQEVIENLRFKVADKTLNINITSGSALNIMTDYTDDNASILTDTINNALVVFYDLNATHDEVIAAVLALREVLD